MPMLCLLPSAKSTVVASPALGNDGTGWSAMPSGYCTTDASHNLPDTSIPNNLLAPWWTDLNLADSGNWYLAEITDGVNHYAVFEWEDAPRYGDPSSTATFQIWIQNGTDQIWFTYGGFTGDTTDGTVGAEDATGTFGDTYYYDGTGTLPVVGVDLEVSQVPGAVGDSHTIYFEANGVELGPFTNCAEMTADTFDGVAFGCDDSEVLPW